MRIDGHVSPGFEPVRDAFAQNFVSVPDGEPDLGASLSVWRGGRPLLSLWGGHADAARSVPFGADSLVMVYSMTKALTSTCVHHLCAAGQLDLDAPVARYWPGFERGDKGAITVRMLLAHRAGLPVVEGDFTLAQVLAWQPVAEALAAQTPLWQPDTDHGYHLRTYGWLVGELFRRAAGCTVGRYFARHIAGPHALDWYLGLPPALEPRVAPLVTPPPAFHAFIASLPDDLLLKRAMSTPSNLFHYDGMWNQPALRATELPSSNSLATADAVAKFYALLLGGDGDGRPSPTPLLPEAMLRDVTRVHSQGADRVLLTQTAFGCGYQLQPWFPRAAGPRCFGHTGAGGAVGLADPDAQLAFAYVPTRLQFPAARIDQRSEAIASALYGCL